MRTARQPGAALRASPAERPRSASARHSSREPSSIPTSQIRIWPRAIVKSEPPSGLNLAARTRSGCTRGGVSGRPVAASQICTAVSASVTSSAPSALTATPASGPGAIGGAASFARGDVPDPHRAVGALRQDAPAARRPARDEAHARHRRRVLELRARLARGRVPDPHDPIAADRRDRAPSSETSAPSTSTPSGCSSTGPPRLPAAASQIRTAPSRAAAISRVPSGLQRSAVSCPACSSGGVTASPVAASQICARLRAIALANRRPSGLHAKPGGGRPRRERIGRRGRVARRLRLGPHRARHPRRHVPAISIS